MCIFDNDQAEQRLCNGPLSVRLSVHLSRRSTAIVACGGFAAGRRAGRAGDLSIDSGGRQALGAQQQMRAVSRLQPPYRRLITDLHTTLVSVA